MLKSNGPKGETTTAKRDRLIDKRLKTDTKRLLTRFRVIIIEGLTLMYVTVLNQTNGWTHYCFLSYSYLFIDKNINSVRVWLNK